MKRLFPLISFLLTACAGNNSNARDYQLEVTLHKIRADIEEIKHDLHTHQMELSVLEGKVLNSEDAFLAMKKEELDHEHGKMDKYREQLGLMVARLAQAEKKQEESEKHVKNLLLHNAEIQKALTQYKDKINELERNLSLQTQSLTEMMKIKDHLKTISEMAMGQPSIDADGHPLQSYRVKAGDSLEKIAKEHRTSVESLRKMNHLSNDLILAGQDLLVPKKPPAD